MTTEIPLETGTEADVEALGLQHTLRRHPDPLAPLVFLIHGRAGNYSVMSTFRKSFGDGFSILSPQAPFADSRGGYSWWEVDKSREESDRQREESTVRLRQFIRAAPLRYGVAPRYLVGVGFSQGAALLSVIIQDEPKLFAGAGLLSGFVIPREKPDSAQLPRVFMFHGRNDETVPFQRALEGESFLRQRGAEVQFVEEAVGHKVGIQGMRAFTGWVQRNFG